jgi:uncharacterized protein (TIGR02145 family)
MSHFFRIATIVTIFCFVLGLAAPVCGRSRERNNASAQTAGSDRDSVTNNSSASDPGFQEKPSEKKAAKKFPWLLVGAGAVAIVTAALLLVGKKKNPDNGDGGINFNGNIEYGTVTDIDGNVYRTVRIGNQEWMAENLKTTRYRNGDTIAHVTGNNSWSSMAAGAYCNYNNDDVFVDTYGRMYNWYAVNDGRNLAPAGWHVSTDTDWSALMAALGGGEVAGGKLKEAGTSHWLSPNEGATNESGFTALPGGYRVSEGLFAHIKEIGYWWTATTDNSRANWAWRHIMLYSESSVHRTNFPYTGGFSVRCVKD